MARPRWHLTVALAAFGVLVAACSGGDGSKIRVGTAASADVTEVVEAPATVAARATATLRSPAEGTVKDLYVADGDKVSKGEPLAVISSPAARDRLKQARDADRQAATSSAPPGVDLSALRRQADRTAKQGFDAARKAAQEIPDRQQRARVLKEIARAQGQYATASRAAQAAVAQLNAGLGSVTQAMSSIAAAQRVQTRAAVRAAERTVDALEIKAPFDGVISLGGPAGTSGLTGLLDQLPPQLRSQVGESGTNLPAPGTGKDASQVAEGAPIATGDAVVTVTDVSTLSLTADVDETDIMRVKRGTKADVEFDAVTDATYTATVTGVGATPKEATGGGVTYKVTLSLRRGTTAGGERAPWPKPGMSAVANLRVREARSVLSVPASAIVTSGKESTVWAVVSGKARRRIVRLGAQGESTVQVLSGLNPGERVVIRGADDVRPGQSVP